MNFRVFTTESDLHAGLREAVEHATSAALNPHVGLVGDLEPWVRAILSRNAPALRLVGHPAPVQHAIESDDALVPARTGDLNEPLDLAIVVGSPPAGGLPWLTDARLQFVAVTRRQGLVEWLAERTAPLDRAWFFVLEGHWSELVGNMGEQSRAPEEDSVDGDELE